MTRKEQKQKIKLEKKILSIKIKWERYFILKEDIPFEGYLAIQRIIKEEIKVARNKYNNKIKKIQKNT